MTTTLAESIQKNLGYPELRKIDPNTQLVTQKNIETVPNQLGQAAIPTVLLGLYKYGNTEKGSEDILRGNISTSWLDLFFADSKEEAISKVAAYAGKPQEEVALKMEEIASESVKIIRENTPEKASFSDVKTYVANQRNSILVFLPAELQISTLVNDNTLDDRTNKMEGPISNAVHFVEKLFSGSTTEKNEDQKSNN
ncbi:MAG: hypothetical protein ABIN89_30870 [Chitinophagaceae bacterium]